MLIRYVVLVSLSAMSFSVWGSFKNDSKYDVLIKTRIVYKSPGIAGGTLKPQDDILQEGVIKPGATFKTDFMANEARLYRIEGDKKTMVKSYTISDRSAPYTITDVDVAPASSEKKK